MSFISNLINNKSIPYNYVVGGKETPSAIPFDVKLSLDKDFKKTVLISVGLISLGIAAGIAIAKRRR